MYQASLRAGISMVLSNHGIWGPQWYHTTAFRKPGPWHGSRVEDLAHTICGETGICRVGRKIVWEKNINFHNKIAHDS